MKRAISIICCAVAFVLTACGNDVASTTKGTRLDVSRFPTVENTVFGGWLASDQADASGVRVTMKIYFNNSQVGISKTCSLNGDSVMASIIAPATIANNQIVIQDTNADNEVGQLDGHDVSCNLSGTGATFTYTLNGEVLSVRSNNHTSNWIRLR